MPDDSDLKAIPSEETITSAVDLQVFDMHGGKVRFGSIFETEKAIVVFISTCIISFKYLIILPKINVNFKGTFSAA